MLQKHLADDGVALLGTKRFYFGEGLGGGTAQLESLINLRPDSTLQLQVVCSIEDGKSNIRDILHVTKKKITTKTKWTENAVPARSLVPFSQARAPGGGSLAGTRNNTL